MRDPSSSPSHRQLAAYFVPLALQAASQSLSYPLVAMVASHGPGGTLNLAGVAQSNVLMFLTGTISAGLVTAGMVYGRTRAGFARFVSVNQRLLIATAVVQAAICIPALGHAVFGALLGLPGSIEGPARQAYPLTILLNVLFSARNPYQVLLYNNGASGRASTATFGRIALTAALSPLFCWLGWVGPRWAMVCQAVPVALEGVASWHYSRVFADTFEPEERPAARRSEIFWFNVPLSLGAFLITLAVMFLGGIIARASQPERMLPAYYLALGLANPMTYAATRMQNVVLSFPPRSRSDTTTLRFTIGAGAFLSFIPLLFLLPWPAHWYYVSLQRLNPADMHLVAVSALLFVGYPFAAGLRAHREGLAALARRPSVILAGNIAFVATLAVSASACLALRVPGNVIGPVSLILSNVSALAVLRYLLRDTEATVETPVAPVTSVEG